MQLNIEQQRLINSKTMGHSLVKGVAGSGKTTVAVHRIPFLIENYCIEKEDKVLFVTFNKSLVSYIRYILSEIPEDTQINIFEKSRLEDKLTVTNIDKILFQYFAKGMQQKKIRLQQATEDQIRSVLLEAVNEVKHHLPQVKLLDYRYIQFIRKEIAWIKACNYRELETYQVADRIGRTSGKNTDGPQKIAKNSDIRRAIYYVMVLYDKKMKAMNLCGFDDRALYALDYVNNLQNEKEIQKFTHIIIDESQDLSKTQLEVILRLYDSSKEYSSILFVADTAQSIYDTSWMTRGRTFTSIGLDMTGKSNSLAKNYRTTTQIAEAAYSLIAHDADITEDINFVKPSLIDKQGSYPVLRGFASIQQEVAYVKDLIQNRLSKLYDYKNIAVVARTKRILEEVGRGFDTEIPFTIFNKDEMDFEKEDVKLVTMHSIKGLEFKVIILVGLNKKVIPNKVVLGGMEDSEFVASMERKLLYVGMTRANERLYMSYHEEPSMFLKEIDSKYLKLQDSARIRTYYSITIQEYQFSKRLFDLYGQEEKVRQWFIKELIETYKYPIKLIDVEYKVQLFSKVGFVDIVVAICRNNDISPYIVVEVKQYGKGIFDALEQLKSYMTVEKKCCYGVVTDGNEFMVINKDFEIVEDIPMFDISMLPSSIEEYTYIDLVHNDEKKFMQDGDNTQEVILETANGQEILRDSRVVKMNVFQDIAAGTPILLQSEISYQRVLPFEWIGSPLESFIVKVKGDSMKDANICNGDQVIIRQQNTGDNGQIVAVEIDGSTTLKRLRRMGNMVCLIPENTDYEPIMVDSSQVRIIGIATGVIKRV